MIPLADDHPAAIVVASVAAEMRRLPDFGTLPTPPVHYSPDADQHGALATGGRRIIFYPHQDDVRPRLERLGRIIADGRRLRDLGPHLPWAVQVAAHELAHVHSWSIGENLSAPTPAGALSLEEGFAGAVGVDLVAPLSWRLVGARVLWRVGMPDGYQACVSLVRRASARASGGAWWARPARSWRLRWAAAPWAARAAEMRRLGLPAGCALRDG